MTSLYEALTLTPAEAPPDAVAAYTVELHEDWTQGRTQFGGLLAGQMVVAAGRVVGPERPLRTVDVAFVGTLATGTADLVVRVLGEGKAVTQLAVEISQAGVLATRAHIVAGTARLSALDVPAQAPEHLTPEFTDPATAGIELPYIEGVTPTFTQHVGIRWCGSAFPFTGAPAEEVRLAGWCRWDDTPPADLDDDARLGALVALLDAWPPTVLLAVSSPAPASTIRWAVHLLHDEVPADDWLWYEARTLSHADGYGTTVDALWDRSGTALAWTEQLVAVYDKPPAA